MAITAVLTVDKKEYKLNDCEYTFYQPVDINNKPAANPKGGIIKFTMNALGEDDLTFHKWMFNRTEVKSGNIFFDLPGSNNKTVFFEQAHCIGLNEFFSKDASAATIQASDPFTDVGSDVGNLIPLPGGDVIGAAVGAGLSKIFDKVGLTDLLGLRGGGSSSEQMLLRISISAAIIKIGKKGPAIFTNNELLV